MLSIQRFRFFCPVPEFSSLSPNPQTLSHFKAQTANAQEHTCASCLAVHLQMALGNPECEEIAARRENFVIVG